MSRAKSGKKARGVTTQAGRRARKPGRPKAARGRKGGTAGRRYSPAEKRHILASSRTASEARERFGVSSLSFYRWRRQAGADRPTRPTVQRRRRGPAKLAGLDTALRSEVRQRIQKALPEILEQEIRAALVQSLTRRGRSR